MSNAAKIQADYEQLGQIAAQFAQQGDRTLALGRQVYNCMSQLQGGGWIGVGADRFYNEMESLVLPGLERLMNALNTGSTQTERIAQLLRSAEEEAGMLFHGGDETYSVAPVTGGSGIGDVTGSVGSSPSGGGMNMGGMIGMMVGGMLGGPLGAMIGGQIGNAIGSGPFSMSGSLSIAEIGKGKPFSPLKMFKNYIGADPAQYKSKFGHDFSKRHLFGKYADGDDKKFINRSVDGKVVLAGGELWNQRGAALRGDLNFQAGALKGNAFGELASYDSSGKWEASIGRDGVKVGASGYAGAYLARAGVSAEMGGLQAAGQAYIGAQVQGELGAVLRPGQAYVGLGGEVFAGGKAEGSISYTQQIVEGLSVKGTASGYVSYGIGAQADVKFGYDEGKIRIGGSLGATLGVGVGGKFDVTIDAKGIVDRGVQTVQQAAGNIVEFGRGVVDIGRFLFSR
ncbi:MAG: WXG100 family type VII secretion target [Aggregatilineales bacterium]